jgi:hypothetical protein
MHLWWGGGEEQVHNVDYDPVKTVGKGGGVNRCIMLVMHLRWMLFKGPGVSRAPSPPLAQVMHSPL